MLCTESAKCSETVIKQVETLCKQRGLRLTLTRKRVLELVWAAHRPMKAYDLLARLQREDEAAKPPTI